MTTTRLWAIGSVVVMLAIAAGAWFLGISPQLDAAATAKSDTSDVESQNFLLQKDLTALEQDVADLAKNQAKLDGLRVSIPASDSLDTFLGQLDKMAVASGVAVTGFTSADSVPFVPSSAAAATVPADISGSNFLSVPITIATTGTRDQILDFVDELQSGDRLILVSDVSVSIGEDGSTTGQIVALLYVLVDEPLVDPNAVATPSPTPTP
jgi:Tfp pilus assembly protein PilO